MAADGAIEREHAHGRSSFSVVRKCCDPYDSWRLERSPAFHRSNYALDTIDKQGKRCEDFAAVSRSAWTPPGQNSWRTRFLHPTTRSGRACTYVGGQMGAGFPLRHSALGVLDKGTPGAVLFPQGIDHE